MRVRFREACTVFPDGEKPVDCVAGQMLDIPDEYARLLIEKGHAAEVAADDAASASARKGKAADNASA